MIKRLETKIVPQMNTDGELYDQEFVLLGFFHEGKQYGLISAYPEDAEALLEGEEAKLVKA